MKQLSKLSLALLLLAVAGSAWAQNRVMLEAGTPYTIASSAEAAGAEGVTVKYQWYRDGSPIPSASAAAYTVPAAQAIGSNVEFKRAAYVDGCDEKKFSNAIIITWCNVLLGGVCWADENVAQPGTFAARPDMHTEFYQWGQTKAWSPSSPAAGVAIADWITSITSSSWKTMPCPEGWRIPTQAEFQALHSSSAVGNGAAGGVWSAAGNATRGNAVAGRFYGARANNTTYPNTVCTLPNNMAGCVFMPASGGRGSSTGALAAVGIEAGYWSSTQYSITEAYLLYALSTSSLPAYPLPKAIAYQLRCVQ